MDFKFVAGIDEAGRGPLAGPVAVGLFVCKKDFDFSKLPGLDDSKKLSAKKREEIFGKIQGLALQGEAKFSVSFISAKVIDTKGINFAIKSGIEKCVKKLALNHKNTFVFLDGLLKVSEEFNQETVIKGDSKIPAISAASICAKVLRDRYMIELSKKYPQYDFEKHKGYGTKNHYKAILKHKISTEHRITFL